MLNERLQHETNYFFDLMATRTEGLVAPSVTGKIAECGDGDVIDITFFGPGGTNLFLAFQITLDGKLIIKKHFFSYDDRELIPPEIIQLFPDPKISAAIAAERKKGT